jgi:HK97 family phage prohead protease
MEFKKITGYRGKAFSDLESGIEFVMSSGSVDRMNEVILPSAWDLTSFKNNPICLYQHDPDEPIGRWENVKVVKNQLVGTLLLAEEGTSDDINAIRALVSQGILKAVSVGFMVNAYREDEKTDSIVYTDVELLECSLVSIPCNDECMSIAKKFNANPEKLFRGFSPSGKALAQSSQSKAVPNAPLTIEEGNKPRLLQAKFIISSFKGK